MKYYKNESTGEVFGFDETDETQLPYMQKAIDDGYVNITGSYPPPPSPPTAEDNKATATSLLQATDWVNQPDVRNTANTPHLINGNEFDAYRLAVRQYAVNPVAGEITFPAVPESQWNS
jgi:hypothetical protein